MINAAENIPEALRSADLFRPAALDGYVGCK
jgi:hypothetical protein